MHEPNRKTRRERGMTLIEVLIALFILFVVMVAVLELITLSYTVSLGAKARTDMMYRAQRVVETLRWQRTLQLAGKTTYDLTNCCPLNKAYTIPTSGTCYDTVWGPAGANVIDSYTSCNLSYSFTGTQVTVEVRPLTSGGSLYRGPVAQKVVRYVAQL
jgi:prepilin-type N-terminal cleavage/methylation domain-containing protein